MRFSNNYGRHKLHILTQFLTPKQHFSLESHGRLNHKLTGCRDRSHVHICPNPKLFRCENTFKKTIMFWQSFIKKCIRITKKHRHHNRLMQQQSISDDWWTHECFCLFGLKITSKVIFFCDQEVNHNWHQLMVKRDTLWTHVDNISDFCETIVHLSAHKLFIAMHTQHRSITRNPTLWDKYDSIQQINHRSIIYSL